MKLLNLSLFIVTAMVISGCTPHSPYMEVRPVSTGTYRTEADSRTSPSVAEASEPRFTAAKDRKIIYTAELTMGADNIDTAIARTREITAKHKGYLVSLTGKQLVLRIPAESADAAMNEIEKNGIVFSRRIHGSDVTREMTDLNIRIDNLNKLRIRLTALFERGKDLEELMVIEKELARTTGEIEQLQGRLAEYKEQTAYITLTINFERNAAVAASPAYSAVITWVNRLGANLGMPNTPGGTWSSHPFTIELPDGFISLYSASSLWGPLRESCSVSADDCVIKLSRRDNLEKGTLSFWDTLIARTLVQRHKFKILDTADTEIDGLKARVITAERTAGREKYKYQLTVAVSEEGFFTSGKIYLIEAWGPSEAFDKIAPELDKVRKSFEY